jgi:hypothetical protein
MEECVLCWLKPSAFWSQSDRVPDVELAVSQTLRVDVTMPVGQLAESVSVQAEAPRLHLRAEP